MSLISLDQKRPRPAFESLRVREEHISARRVHKNHDIEQRKRDHLEPFRTEGVPARAITTWLENVHLVHNALPELDAETIDPSSAFAGRRFDVPLFVTGMTGGTTEAEEINNVLAEVCQAMGIGLGLGSMRAMLERPELTSSYQVRRRAPGVFLAGNIGAVQLARYPIERVQRALDSLEADALCVHINPAQEMMQPEGDRNYRGVLEAIETLVRRLERPLIVKEVGAGISREVARRLVDVGVGHLDVSGAGGTSWCGVEIRRSGQENNPHRVAFWDWGIPTAAAVWETAGLPVEVMASGGIRTGLDAARALALGAKLVGMAAPVMQAYYQGGGDAVRFYLEQVVDGIRTAMMLTGSANLEALRRAPRVIRGELRQWIEARAKTGD